MPKILTNLSGHKRLDGSAADGAKIRLKTKLQKAGAHFIKKK